MRKYLTYNKDILKKSANYYKYADVNNLHKNSV